MAVGLIGGLQITQLMVAQSQIVTMARLPGLYRSGLLKIVGGLGVVSQLKFAEPGPDEGRQRHGLWRDLSEMIQGAVQVSLLITGQSQP